jgi:phage gp36-like protein
MKKVFDEIRKGMLDVGFRQDGRVFTMDIPARHCCDLARAVLEELKLEQQGMENVHNYVKEFYGFNFSDAVNLLVPHSEDYCVVEYGDAGVIRSL